MDDGNFSKFRDVCLILILGLCRLGICAEALVACAVAPGVRVRVGCCPRVKIGIGRVRWLLTMQCDASPIADLYGSSSEKTALEETMPLSLSLSLSFIQKKSGESFVVNVNIIDSWALPEWFLHYRRRGSVVVRALQERVRRAVPRAVSEVAQRVEASLRTRGAFRATCLTSFHERRRV